MSYSDFILSTLAHDNFKFILTNTNGTCCYHSILKLLKKKNLIHKNLNTKTIQAQAVNWIIKNRDNYLSNFDLLLEDYVLMNHNLSCFSDYISNYKIYSANNGSNSWGGIPELIALSSIYKVNIHVYTGKSYDKRRNKIIKGTIINNKPRKDFRFKLLMSTTREYNQDLNILYIELKRNISHFIGLE